MYGTGLLITVNSDRFAVPSARAMKINHNIAVGSSSSPSPLVFSEDDEDAICDDDLDVFQKCRPPMPLRDVQKSMLRDGFTFVSSSSG